jgi:hypothetical protein
VHAELLPLHLLKSSGYGTDADPLVNYVEATRGEGVSPMAYARMRAREKLARCASLEAQGRVGELEEEHKDVASLLLCAEALRRRTQTAAREDVGYSLFGRSDLIGPEGPPAVAPRAARLAYLEAHVRKAEARSSVEAVERVLDAARVVSAYGLEHDPGSDLDRIFAELADALGLLDRVVEDEAARSRVIA